MAAVEVAPPPGFELDPPPPPGFELDDGPSAPPPPATGMGGVSAIPGAAPTDRAPASTRPVRREATKVEGMRSAVTRAMEEAKAAGEVVSEVLNQFGASAVGMPVGFATGLAELGVNKLRGVESDPNLLEERTKQGVAKLAARDPQLVRNPVSDVGQERIEQVGRAMEMFPPTLGHQAPLVGAATGSVAPAIVKARGAARGMGEALERITPTRAPAAGTKPAAGAAGTDMATQRRERAADLPVPVKLTEGDATRDYAQQRFEKETAKDPDAGAPLREAQADKTKAVTENFEQFVEQTGAQTTDARAVGKSVTDPIFAKAEAAKAEIREAYKKADEAGETAQPVPYKPVLDYIDQQTPTTREKLAPIIKMVEEQLANNDPNGTGEVTIQQLEDVRKAIRANAEFGTPNSVHGQELIRLIDQTTEGAGGDLYKAARGMYRDYAAEFKNQGVIRDLIGIKKGTVDRKVAFEDVFDRSVLRGSLDDLTKVKETLLSAGPKGEQAWRDMRGTAIEHIRKAVFSNDARDQRGQVTPSSAKFGRAIDKLDEDGKLEFMFGKQGAAQLRDLREIVADIYTAPAGAVNTSNTTSVLRQALKAMADAALTFTATGVPVPAIAALRVVADKVRSRKTDKLVQKALGPNVELPPSKKRAFEEAPAPPPPAAKPPAPPPPAAAPPAARAPAAPPDPRLAELERLKADASPEVAKVLDEQAAQLKATAARTRQAEELDRKAGETTDPEIRAALRKRANELRPEKIPAAETRELATTPTPKVKEEKIPAATTKEVQPTAEEAAALEQQRAADTTAYEAKFFADKKVSPLEQQRVRAVDRAIELDEQAVFKAAQQHENSPGAFDRAIAKIIEEGERRANEGEQAAVVDAAVPAGPGPAAVRAEPGAGQPRPDGDAAAGAERGGAVQPGRQAPGPARVDEGRAAGQPGDQAGERVAGAPEAAQRYLVGRPDVSSETRQAIVDRYYGAEKAKPKFDGAMQRASQALGDSSFELKLVDLKGPERATDKVVSDYAGDASRIKDLVRGTIVIRDIDSAADAIKALGEQFGELKGLRNGLDPAAKVGPDGYRDIKATVMIDGEPAEVQVNVPSMMAAKDEAHPLMKQRDTIQRRAQDAGRLLTPAEGALVRALDERMAEIYADGWKVATMRRNSASSTPRALRENETPDKNARSTGSQAFSAYSADRTTGTPSTSQKSEPAGNEAGSAPAAGSGSRFIAGSPASILGSSPTGRETIATTERGTEIKVRYRLVDVGQLVTSHDDALRPNPAFDQTLQPRDRSRMSSESQIAKIQNGIKPELLADSWKASDGAPIVGADGAVESGNARTIALRRAYGSGQADEYKAWLAKHAERFGFDAGQVTGIERPVLIREGLGQYDRAEFARQANESSVASLSATEQAFVDAKRLPDFDGVVVSDDGAMNLASSGEIVRDFMRSVPEGERNGLMTKDGRPSQALASRIRNAFFAKAYGDADVIAMLTESTDSNVKNVLAGLLRAAIPVGRVRDLMQAGARSGRDFAPDLVEAVRLYAGLRQDGMTVSDYLAQGSLIGGEASPEVATILRGLEANARAPKRIAEMIEKMASDIDQAGDPRQSGMFD